MDNKEVKTNESNTTTTVAEKKPIEVNSILFIMFAEFLGYESPLIAWAEKICNGVSAPLFVETILKIEASTIFKEMQKEYTIAEIRSWYDQFYPVILQDYDVKLMEMNKDDLPF